MKLESFLQRMGFLQLLALSGCASVIGFSIAVGNSYFSSLQENMVRQEMTRSSELIASISVLENFETYFQGGGNVGHKQGVEKIFQFIAHTPDIIRLNAYDANYKVIWSNEAKLVGTVFKDNEELKIAYAGLSNFNLDERGLPGKEEHDFLPAGVDQFVESYIPVWDDKRESVVGVVETYKSPAALFQILEIIQLGTGLASLLLGGLLCALLYWMLGMVYQRQHMQKQPSN